MRLLELMMRPGNLLRARNLSRPGNVSRAGMVRRAAVAVPIVLFVLAAAVACSSPPGGDVEPSGDSRAGTREQRAELFDQIIAMTERREAFSPRKEQALGYSPLDDMGALRDELVDAETEADLYYALVKLSNARRDHHLSVDTVDQGLRPPQREPASAPIHVLADYADIDAPSFFIAAVDEATELPGRAPEPGDLIVSVNGRPVADYVTAFTPWVVHSSIHGLYGDMARDLPLRLPDVSPEMYDDVLRLELERAPGDRFPAELPYLEEVDVPEVEPVLYPGFTEVLTAFNFNVWLPDDDRPVVLLQWLDFELSLIEDVVSLMDLAEGEGILEHALIIDVTFSSGGSRGAYAIQRLVDRPFRTTFGNLRVSDGAAPFIERWSAAEPDPDAPEIFGLNESRSWLYEWARTDAAAAFARGDEYTEPVPFKLAHLPKDSDGILQPAPVHFSGPIVILDGPRGGSHLDQFVAMFADNDLARVIGMPAGGYSNTWEAEEILHLPGTEQPLVNFMWNIGHTLRPNGEILEGNPVWPDHYIPLTRENFRAYHQILLAEALAYLGAV